MAGNTFGELLDRVAALCKLRPRDAMQVAEALWDDDGADEQDFAAQQIVAAARACGFDVPDPAPAQPNTPAAEISMDPAEVLAEVYENCPRVLCGHMPKLGRAPAEAQRLVPELVEQLPEDVLAMLVKVDVLEGKATFWLRDEANDVDRPIGPIDVTRYQSGAQLREAFNVLIQRLDRVLAADFN
jgi:hypothetical protein